MYERSRNILDCHVAGFTYYDGLDVIKKIKLGTVVSLKSEPDNPYDPNAVAIYYLNTKLGYIPQAKNSFISNILYFGHADILESRINYFDPESIPENQLRISVKIRDNRN